MNEEEINEFKKVTYVHRKISQKIKLQNQYIWSREDSQFDRGYSLRPLDDNF